MWDVCTTTCGRGVYKFDYTKRKAVVTEQNHCMVACQTCANLCPMEAISFVKKGETTRGKAQKIVKDFQLLPKVKKELAEKRKELEYK